MLAACFLSLVPAFSQESATRNIAITVTLEKDGSALVQEVWDMSVYRGTEEYLVRYNLGDITVSDLKVTDETGREYVNEGAWDVNRSLEAKAGRCGIVRKSNGCEICWGLGSYGNHTYKVEYRMSNVVKSMDDYDCLHMQFVSPGVSPRPQSAGVTVLAPGTVLNDGNSAIWAFGYEGTVVFKDGAIVASTDAPFTSDEYSMILLVRFDKGLFSPVSTLSGKFEQKKEKAFQGSAYKEFQDEQMLEDIISAVFAVLFAGIAVLIAVVSARRRNRRIFGVSKLSEIGYSRDLPFDGNLFETRYVLSKIAKNDGEGNMAAALILRMVKDRILAIGGDANGKVEISFNANASTDGLNHSEKQFYDFLKEAAGSDGVLQHKEFSRWARKNTERVTAWVTNLPVEGGDALRTDGYLTGKTFTEAGQKHARGAVGFRKFLKDFTLIDERKSVEVALWQDYLIFASLFGCADKVAKELRDINPQAFQAYVGYDYPTMHSVIIFSNNMSSGVTGAVARQTRSSVRGGGGFSSFGGGGGFSGGGFGGGVR